MNTRTIGLLITWKCNASCKHCCFQCGPDRDEVMPYDDAVSFIEQASKIPSVKGVAFSGGEPFIDYDKLLKLTSEAGKRGLHSRIVTNGFWAQNPKRAHTLLEPLVANGLSTLSVSFDAVHGAFVPLSSTIAAVHAAISLKVKVIISVAILNGEATPQILNMRKQLNLQKNQHVYVKVGYISPNGRALKNFYEKDFSWFKADNKDVCRLHQPCTFVVIEPVITPKGDLAICCSPATATRDGFRPEFIYGNLHQNSLGDLIERLNADPIYSFLLLYSPWELCQLAKKLEQNYKFNSRFVNLCDCCSSILSNPSVVEKLRNNLEARSLEFMIKKMHIEACANTKLDEYLLKRSGVFRV